MKRFALAPTQSKGQPPDACKPSVAKTQRLMGIPIGRDQRGCEPTWKTQSGVSLGSPSPGRKLNPPTSP